MGKRSTETFLVKRGLTERMRKSAIPHMQRLLNEDDKKKRDICRQISNYKPVNNDFVCKSVSQKLKTSIIIIIIIIKTSNR